MNKLVVAVLTALIAMGVVACTSENREANKDAGYTVFLASKDMNSLIETKVDINADTTVDKIKEIVKILKKGNGSGKATIPEIVNLSDIKIEGANVILNFDATYSEMTSVEEIICRSSIVKSLTELPDIKSVEFYIGSVPFQNLNGVVEGAMSPEDVVLDFPSDNESEQTKKVTLYFSDKNAEYLVPVEYEISLNSEEQIEKTILGLLIKGPKDDTLLGTIPPDTKIKSIYTNQGVCYVDLSEEFVTKHMGGATVEMMTIYSIVNSLTELENINKVQFLIEGSKREQFKGHLEFDVLFQRNLDLIQK